jgi:hypothetical protein
MGAKDRGTFGGCTVGAAFLGMPLPRSGELSGSQTTILVSGLFFRVFWKVVWVDLKG